MRRLTTRGGGATRTLDNLIESVFVSELIAPSPDVWLLSPWISDIPVVDNRGGEVISLIPGAPARHLRLTEVLLELARRGSHVHVLARNDPRHQSVLDRLRGTPGAADSVDVQIIDQLHDKGLLTSRIHVQGSMNFTHHGRAVNEEGITVTGDADALSRARLDYQARFGMLPR
ncbi:phospholipase D-like domain-containing protein DpdK [Micromonospora chersina]|uniref:phospholipase D-like domain-containing protein DpdK n=1 Tax=Micromonospora chersina TaxID=47854 RepID=UPI0033AB6E50